MQEMFVRSLFKIFNETTYILKLEMLKKSDTLSKYFGRFVVFKIRYSFVRLLTHKHLSCHSELLRFKKGICVYRIC